MRIRGANAWNRFQLSTDAVACQAPTCEADFARSGRHVSSGPPLARKGDAGRTRGPTIRDVAASARVGVATVSRVLNNSPQVSEPTRRRVRRTIEDLGYRRSPAARSLSTGRTQTIGVVAPFFTTRSVVERVRGVVDALRSQGDYDLMLFDVESPEQRLDAFNAFARPDRVDGVLVISLALGDDDVGRLRGAGVPAVLIDVTHPELSHIAIDDVLGGAIAGRHLVRRGHTRIGFVGDAPSRMRFTSSERRRDGLREALREAGIPLRRQHQRRGSPGRESARELAGELLDGSDRPTALFAASDDQAVGVLEAAAARGLRVPDDVAVMGFDDVEVAAALGLTTVRQPLRAMGRRGAELLLGEIAGDRAVVREVAPVELVVRRTA